MREQWKYSFNNAWFESDALEMNSQIDAIFVSSAKLKSALDANVEFTRSF